MDESHATSADPGRGGAANAAASPWLIIVGVFCVYLAFGVLNSSTGALVPSIRADLDLTRGQMGVVLGAWQLAFIAAAVPAGRVIDRFGIRSALLASIAIMVVSALARSIATGFATLLISVAILGFGAPLVAIGAPKTAAVLFEGSSRGRAVAMYQVAPTVGAALALGTANGIVSTVVGDSWRSASLVYAGFGIAMGAFWYWVSRGLQTTTSTEVLHESAIDLLKLPVVRVMLIIAVAGFMFNHGIGQWLVDLLADGGRSLSTAGYLAAIGSIIAIVFTGVIPAIAVPKRRVAVLATTLIVGSFGTASLTMSGNGVLIAIATSSVARVAVLPLCMLILMDHRSVGSKNIAVAAGLFFTAAQVGGVIGPFVTGSLADSSGSFDRPMTLYAALMAGIAAFVLIIVPSVTRDPDSARPTRREMRRRR